MIQYKTILCDPPWKETGGGKIKRGADKHYNVLSEAEIISLTQTWLNGNVADDAHLYLWVTNTFLPAGLRVMDSMGFRYITNIVWVKNRIGLGRYFRGQHEICLFGTRGNGWKVRTESNKVRSILTDAKRQHSRKPDSFYDIIESRSQGPYLELFAREQKPGWDVMGDQTQLFTPVNTVI